MQMSFKGLGCAVAGLALVSFSIGCSRTQVRAKGTDPEPTLTTVGVTTVTVKPLSRYLTVSSELVPFQEIDVYAKESGYVKQLLVDYGTRVKKGDLMAVLEIPELETKLARDAATVKRDSDLVTHAQNELNRTKALYNVAHLEYTRLDGVFKTRPGLIAQQEIDDAQGKDLSAEAQVEAADSALLAAENELDEAKAQQQEDQFLFDYSKITAPFNGVVTQRYANFGTLMSAGTNSSTQALPLVRLSEDDLFRLVIPVAESYVKFIKDGEPVQVSVPSLGKTFPGKVARISEDVTEDTRTMHTEVDVENPRRELMPGMYAEATLMLQHKNDALVVPLQAVTQTANNQGTVFTVDPNNRVQSRTVTVGLQTATDAEVTSGLNQGDRVIVSDRSGLKPGTEVRAQNVQVLEYQGESGQSQ